MMVPVLIVFALLFAAAPASAAMSDAPAGARVVSCHRSPSLDARTVVVGTWMKALPAARRLLVKIELHQRVPGGVWTVRDDVPGLGVWTAPSDPSLGTRPADVFKYRQAVGELAVPAAYRFRVSFRWLDAAGALVSDWAAVTGVCRQPDLRADLVLSELRSLSADDGSVRYLVRLSNEGRTTVARVVVAATFPGESTPDLHVRSVRGLVPGRSVIVAFAGPGCSAGELPAAFAADPANALDEAHEANNMLGASCPAP